MWKRNRQHSQESSPQRIQRHPEPWPTEFGLSDAQKDRLILDQARQIARQRERYNSLYGVLTVIAETRSEDKALAAFCKAAQDGWATFTIGGGAK